MRVLLVSEGKHELGTGEKQGALWGLVLQVLTSANSWEVIPRRVRELDYKTHGRFVQGRHASYEKRALACLREAEKDNFNCLIFVIDQDGDCERHQGVASAQGNIKFGVQRAMGVAIKSFDAWMLADETAWSKALDRTVLRQRAPEEIHDPKATCEELARTCGRDRGLAELYAQIAANIRVDEIVKRCPLGFKPFYERLRALQTP